MSKLDWRGKNVLILGFGRSGYSSAKRLLTLKANVFISEEKDRASFDDKKFDELASAGVRFEFGGHTGKFIEGADMVILSPGVHLDIPIVKDAIKKGIRTISEIEFAYELLKKPIIAVTGTNGKTTTATLIGEILKAKGLNVAVAGNIGFPLSEVDDQKLDFSVCEVSSYQLEGISCFRPWISLILNITEDHIERHKSMREYANAKGRIFMNERESDFIIYNADDPLVVNLVKKAKAKKIPFSRKDILKEGAFVDSGYILSKSEGRTEKICKANEIFIKGEHNLENALAASAAGIIAGVPPIAIAKTLKEFKGVEHRIEYVSNISGIDFFNDSKGTNPDSTIVALKALDRDIILIAGGRDKGGDLSKLVKESKGRVKSLILIGEAKDRFHKAFARENGVSITESATMEDAVRAAFKGGREGDHVLLSPACASFDMFRDYEERGKVFKEIVRSLGRENNK